MRHVAIHSASISIYDRDSIRHFCYEKMGFPASQVWLERVWLISAFAGEIARICPFMVWDEKKGWRNVVNPIVKKQLWRVVATYQHGHYWAYQVEFKARQRKLMTQTAPGPAAFCLICFGTWRCCSNVQHHHVQEFQRDGSDGMSLSA